MRADERKRRNERPKRPLIFRMERRWNRECEERLLEFLGISKTADASAIKKAYRKLAKKYHPDSNPGKQGSAEKFKEVTEAYDVLGDEKRESYMISTVPLPCGGGLQARPRLWKRRR